MTGAITPREDGWTRAGDALPEPGQTVLLWFPMFIQRPWLATLVPGDPDHPGAYYRQDTWRVASLFHWGNATVPVKPHHMWAPVPTPPGLDAWTDTRREHWPVLPDTARTAPEAEETLPRPTPDLDIDEQPQLFQGGD